MEKKLIMSVGPYSILMETTHNYSSGSSNQLMEKISGYKVLLAQTRELYVCTLLRYCLMAHNHEHFMRTGKKRSKSTSIFF